MALNRLHRPFLVSLLATALLALVLAWLVSSCSNASWEGMALAKAGRTAEYCEANHFDAFLRQPVNAWSNLIYFFFGTWVIVQGIHDFRLQAPRNALAGFPALSVWMGICLWGLCFGSFFFHASVTMEGQHWDMGFTYAVALSLVALGGFRWSLLLGRPSSLALKLAWLGIALGGAVVMAIFKWKIDGKIALPVLMLTGLALAVGVYLRRRGYVDGRMLLMGVLALLLSGVFRAMDLAKVLCDPDGWLQMHALWHVCTGLAAFLFWKTMHLERAGKLGD
jgi:predicted membrane channel-forming protein YqfA (hemolysin III family)